MSLRKLVQKCLDGKVAPSGEITNVVTRGHTARSVTAGPDYYFAEEWSKCSEGDQMESHPACKMFLTELRSIPAASGIPLQCVRGRLQNDRPIEGWLDMGPPNQPIASRYNSSDEVALYLADSEKGVLRELRPDRGKILFLQNYRIDPSLYRIADFSAENLSEFVASIFDFTESSNVVNRGFGRSDWSFSQLVGRLVKEAAFDGMIVPGVRGDNNFQYCNVVMFDARDRWKTWNSRDAGFRSIVVA